MLFGYDADTSPQFGTNLIRIKGLAGKSVSNFVVERQGNNVGYVIAEREDNPVC
jgi:hypothetical protein